MWGSMAGSGTIRGGSTSRNPERAKYSRSAAYSRARAFAEVHCCSVGIGAVDVTVQRQMRTGPATLLCFIACVTPPAPVPPAAHAPTEIEQLATKLQGLVGHASAVLKARGTAVWTFRLGGAPGPADPASA